MAPYQTVCNYLVYFFNPLGTHQSATVAGRHAPSASSPSWSTRNQENSLGSTESTQPVDVRIRTPTPHQQSLHTQYGGPAIDSSGRADCQAGQTGYPNRLVSDGRYRRRRTASRRRHHVVSTATRPGWRGGTFKARQLGIDHLEDVP